MKPDDGIIVEILMPYLYKEQREKPHFNIKNFLLNLLKGIIHALINFYFTINIVNNNIDKDGHESNLWVISTVLYTNILLIVSFDMIIFTRYHTWLNWVIVICLTFMLYIIFLIMVENITFFTSSGTMIYTFNSKLVWMNFINVAGLCFMFDFCILIINQFFVRNIYNLVRSLDNKNDISYEYIKTLPDELQKLLLIDDKVIKSNNKNSKINKIDIINNKNDIIDNNTFKEDIKNDINENDNINIIPKDINKESNEIKEIKENTSINKPNNSNNKTPMQKRQKKRKPNMDIKINDFSLNKAQKERTISIEQKDNKDNEIINPNKNIDITNKSNIIKTQKNTKSKKPFENIKFSTTKKNINNFEINEPGTNREEIS